MLLSFQFHFLLRNKFIFLSKAIMFWLFSSMCRVHSRHEWSRLSYNIYPFIDLNKFYLPQSHEDFHNVNSFGTLDIIQHMDVPLKNGNCICHEYNYQYVCHSQCVWQWTLLKLNVRITVEKMWRLYAQLQMSCSFDTRDIIISLKRYWLIMKISD